MSDGFTVDVEDARKVAEESLPGLAAHLETQLTTLRGLVASHGPGSAPEAANQAVFTAHTELLAGQLKRGCAVIRLTADALDEIVKLYQRVDGQR